MQDSELEYVGFWARTGASLIDAILLAIIIAPPMIYIYGENYVDSKRIIEGPADFLISWVLPMFMVIIFWLKKQATPGKMVISARIVDAQTGQGMGVGQAAARYLAYVVSILPLGLGLLWIAFDARKQGWHDKIAGTVVIRNKRQVPVIFQ